MVVGWVTSEIMVKPLLILPFVDIYKNKKEDELKKVSANVYVETDIFACNLGLITTKEGNIMIDTPHFATDAVKWREEILKKGELRYLINTEEHPDHTDTGHYFSGIVITHQKTREHLSKVPTKTVVDRQRFLDPKGSELLEGFRLKLANITFTESLDLFLGELTLKLFSLPGHSSGGIAVYIPAEKIVFTTDIVFCQKKSWLHEANPEKWLQSLKKIGDLDVDIIVPGHGELCNKDYLAEQTAIIQGWIDVVKSAIERGLSLEEACDKVSVPDPYPKQLNTPYTEEELNKKIISRLYSFYKT